MIASVRGRVLAVRLDSCVLEVGGVGLLLQATPATLAGLRTGQEAELATSLVVREDSLTLFGFADADERDVFETVQTVSGIGPRLALAMLAVHSPDGLRAAVAAQDLTALTKVPGIGRKGAQRIVLELTDRLGAPTGVALVTAGGGAAPTVAAEPWREQVVEALVGLGWPVKAAGDAVVAVAGSAEDDRVLDVTEPPDVAQVLRAALKELGRT
ncbi:Holliday junction branch migration protein RuvA [Spongisporangium articulatum]|uniref:Holliday junction branch migration complex subunit RuvA n=1 Tax=Spongisporangium articulatum TaxID=3362603 RepID=A0ABW8ARZ1_9ACTN